MVELFRNEAADLHRYARRKLHGDWFGAEDLVQMAFRDAVVAWARVGGFTVVAQRKWLRRVVWNKAVDDLRRRGALDVIPDVPESGPLQTDTGYLAELSIALEAYRAVMTGMSETKQKIAFLYWGLSWQTKLIAEDLGIAPVTVRGHIAVIRATLRDAIGYLIPFIDDVDDEEEDEGKSDES
ncbi:MAG: sigma-70 family RNA polymerase sigma factor [Umezawaea sp.]